MEWIKCSEQLPEQYERVLVFIAGESDIGYRDSLNHWQSAYRDGWCVPVEHITHWMPLPEPLAE